MENINWWQVATCLMAIEIIYNTYRQFHEKRKLKKITVPVNQKRMDEMFPEDNWTWFVEHLEDKENREGFRNTWKEHYGSQAEILYVSHDDIPAGGSITVIQINDGYVLKAGHLIHFKKL